MAFNQKEQDIIKWGLANGKSKEEVTQALTNFRTNTLPKPVTPPEPSFLGKVARETIRPFAQGTTNIVNAAQIATGQPQTQPFSGDYLGEVQRLGKQFDITKGFTPENIAALKEASKAGIDIGLLISGGGGTKDIIGTGLKEGFKRGAIEGAKTFGTIGAVQGASTGLEPGATVLDTLKNTVLGGVTGAGLGLTTGGVLGGLSGVSKVTSTLNKGIEENTVKYSNRFLTGLKDSITKIDPQTENILKTTSIEKFNNYVKIGEEALSNPRVLTPLERAGDKVYNQVLPTIKEDLGNIGSQKAKSLASVKNVQVPNATTDVISFIKESTKNSRLTNEENKLINEAISTLELGTKPTLGTLDKTVDLLQNTLYEKTRGLAIPVTSRVEGIINQAIGKLNNTVKEAAQKALGSNEYTVLNNAYATKIDIFNRLNKALGEDASKGGSLFKRFFSPQDSGTKNLFAEIKQQYGIDLAEDATLAKFVMDSLGDVRSKSLLEQIPLSKGGIITKGLQKVEETLTDPLGKAKRIIEKRPQDQLLEPRQSKVLTSPKSTISSLKVKGEIPTTKRSSPFYVKGKDGKLLGSIPKNKVQTIDTKFIKFGEDFKNALGDINIGEKSKNNLPALLGKNIDGTYFVIDGNHRIAEVMRKGSNKIEFMTDEKLYRKLSKLVDKIK